MSKVLSIMAANPFLKQFAHDHHQRSVRQVANFIAPSVEVPSLTFKYKKFDAKHRFKRPETRRAPGGPATVIGFDATDAEVTLVPRALDFPFDNLENLSAEVIVNMIQDGMILLSDSATLDHEVDVIDKALAAAGSGTDSNWESDSVDPIKILNAEIRAVKKAARNSATIKVLFGLEALDRFGTNKNVRARYNGDKKGIATPTLEEISRMLLTGPEVDYADMVQDTAAEGLADSIDFIMSDQVLIFASNSTPNRMDASFMKTFRLMGNWMKPGSYTSADERDEILKLDWAGLVAVTNSDAIRRVNAKAS